MRSSASTGSVIGVTLCAAFAVASSGAPTRHDELAVRIGAVPKVRPTAVKACNIRAGHEKGRVERPIGFVRTRFWPGRRFSSLLDLNRQAVD